MRYTFRIAVIFILLFFITTVSSATTSSGRTTKKATTQKSEKKVRRKTSLLSSLLLLDVIAAKRNERSSGSALFLTETDHDSDYLLPFLQDPEMKERAVAELYKKHGYNKAVKFKLRSFSKYKYSFQKRLVRSGRYIGTMADIFSEEGLPHELVFLPLIESQFDPYAFSRTKAAGPWQFMPATARRLNLKIDWWIDERRDPIKSTRAAASYLKYLHKKFGAWNLALAAYNAGEGRIGKALRYSRKKDFWSLRKTAYLARETKNYVPSFIAATAIAMHPENFGFAEINYYEPLTYDEVIIKNPMDLEVAAKFAGVKTPDIRELNPELRRLCTPPNVPNYTLRIPKGTKRRFMKNLAKTKDYEPYYINLYTVQQGDTVEKIATQIGSTIQSIVDINALGKKALITAGKSILVPIEKNWLRLMQSGSY
jgi:membrane-bound lytic murein transglycosylase D